MTPIFVLALSIIVLLIYIVALLWPPKKARLPKAAYHQSLGRAGDSLKRYQPKRNLNRIINRLVCGEVKAFAPSAMITQQKQIPDVSFWQGLISWNEMASKTDTVIIRVGQNTWEDSAFRFNYAAAKMHSMLRGAYWFYDDRVSPGVQAAKLIELIADDLPELELFCDWENTYGGQFKGLSNVVAFMQAVEKALPIRMGFYTGYWWMVENSNAILNYSQYNYLKDKPLWLASYTDASAVRIPAPWTSLDFWQWGTPAVAWGQSSAEIDMSFWNRTEQEFYNRYAGNTTPPTETEQSMSRYEAINTYAMSRRPAPSVSNTPLQPGIAAQSRIHGDVLTGERGSGECWLAITDINGAPSSGYVAVEHGGVTYCALTEINPPVTETFPARVGLTFDGTTIKWYVAE